MNRSDDEDNSSDLDKMMKNLPSAQGMLSAAFLVRSKSSGYWVMLANSYLVGSQILFREADKGAIELITKVDLDNPEKIAKLLAHKDLYLPAKFLLAQACELLLKAIGLSKGIDIETLKTHNLIDIAKKVGANFSRYEIKMLNLMHREIVWASRYPVPNRERDYDIDGVDLGFDETRRYRILGIRIYRRLYRILSSTWT